MSNFYAFITGYSYSALRISPGGPAAGDIITHMRSVIVYSETTDALTPVAPALPLGGVPP